MKPMILALGIVLVVLFSGCAAPEQPPTEPTPTPAQMATPRDALAAQRQAVNNCDLEDLKKTAASEVLPEIEQLTSEQFTQLCPLMQALLVPMDSLVVENETIEGDTATWEVTDSRYPEMSTGTITFVKEGGEWKIHEEKWTNTYSG